MKQITLLALLFVSFSSAQNVLLKNEKTNPITRIDSLVHYLFNPSDSHVMIAAHRADWRNFPENSLEGIKSCIAMGVHIVEIDVQRTKDNQFILMHDKTLDRTSTGSGKISEFTLEELQKFNLKNAYGYPTNYKIPTLKDALYVVKGKSLIFIDKGYNYINDIYTLLQETETIKEALFEGKVSVEKLKFDYPALWANIKYMPRVSFNEKNAAVVNYINEYVANKTIVATFITNYNIKAESNLVFIQEIRKQGISVMANTLWPETAANRDDDFSLENPIQGWGWHIKKGANIICTDRPKELLQFLKYNQNKL